MLPKCEKCGAFCFGEKCNVCGHINDNFKPILYETKKTEEDILLERIKELQKCLNAGDSSFNTLMYNYRETKNELEKAKEKIKILKKQN